MAKPITPVASPFLTGKEYEARKLANAVDRVTAAGRGLLDAGWKLAAEHRPADELEGEVIALGGTLERLAGEEWNRQRFEGLGELDRNGRRHLREVEEEIAELTAQAEYQREHLAQGGCSLKGDMGAAKAACTAVAASRRARKVSQAPGVILPGPRNPGTFAVPVPAVAR